MTSEKPKTKKGVGARGRPLTSERAAELGRMGSRSKKPTVTQIEIQAIRERLAPEIDATFNRLVQLRDSDDESISLRACSDILDRFYGKPAQDVNLSSEAPIHLEVVGADIIANEASRGHAAEFRRSIGATRAVKPRRAGISN